MAIEGIELAQYLPPRYGQPRPDLYPEPGTPRWFELQRQRLEGDRLRGDGDRYRERWYQDDWQRRELDRRRYERR